MLIYVRCVKIWKKNPGEDQFAKAILMQSGPNTCRSRYSLNPDCLDYFAHIGLQGSLPSLLLWPALGWLVHNSLKIEVLISTLYTSRNIHIELRRILM